MGGVSAATSSSGRRASRRTEPLGRVRRVAPTLYILILIGASLLLFLNNDAWLAGVLIACHVLMVGSIIYVARRPEDTWTGPRLRRPVD